jgi:cold shock CspA family protein
MSRPNESFNKKNVRNKKEKKRKEKEARKKARKEQGKASFDDMIAYVDEFGNIVDTPPDPDEKEEINAEDIIIGIPPKDSYQEEEEILSGTVTYWNDEKGFGFIKTRDGSSYFVHVTKAYEGIREGDRVNFDYEMGDKGPVAINVQMA